MSLKYYLYLSHLKIGLLAAQVASAAQHETELAGPEGRPLQPQGGAARAPRPRQAGEGDPAPAGRRPDRRRLRGTPLLQACLEMRWQVFPTAGIVVFAGTLDDQVVVLGGSASHVVGGGDAEPVGSVPPYLFRKLQELRADPGEFDDERFHESLAQIGAALPGPAQRVEFVAKRLAEKPGPNGTLLGSPIYVALVD
ncbi:SAVMC3_10250 family protein [Micromonospora sp. BRA006-A]|nr:SAVMC3_10250 family protein [Micromonospora sp. BRA006-A]